MKEKLAAHGGPRAVSEELLFSWPVFTDGDIASVGDQLRQGHASYYSSTSAVDELEGAFARTFGRKYAIALNSGTSALFIAYKSLGLGEGHEVLAPTYTFPATATPLLQLGCKIRFYDTLPNSSVSGVSQIAEAITPNTKAVVLAHIDGYASDATSILQLCKSRGILLIEDCAQAFGAEANGNLVGSFGDAAVFSLTDKKLVVAGEGGMLLTDCRATFERAVLLSYLQKRSKRDVTGSELAGTVYTGLGFNMRMHHLAATLGRSQFARWKENLEARERVFARLQGAMAAVHSVRFAARPSWVSRLGHYSTKLVYIGDREDLDDFLAAVVAEGVPAVRSETIPLHLCSVFQSCKDELGSRSLPNAENYWATTFRLPPYYQLEDRAIWEIGAAFEKVERWFAAGRDS